MASAPAQSGHLRRSLGLVALIAYGVGDILGAGIYALVGKVSGEAGHLAWLSFGVAMGVAAFTALAYSELVGRFPRAGGEARFCERGFNSHALALIIGWLVLCSGVVSLAAVSNACAGYVQGMAPNVPAWSVVLVFLIVVGLINFWGIRQSSMVNIVCTLIEASGLLIVLIVGAAMLLGGGDDGAATASAAEAATGAATAATGAASTANGNVLIGVFAGGATAFFAFIGFEDMVNVAEEAKQPRRHFPIAIMTALLVAGGMYMLVTYVATSVVPPAELAESKAPLLDVVRKAEPRVPGWSFTLIALFAVANTGLLNFIMGSRLLYGMADQRLLPAALAKVHEKRRTPHLAIAVVFFAGLALALSGTLEALAQATSALLLIVFITVNLALLAIKRRDARTGKHDADEALPDDGRVFHAPAFVPVIGVLTGLGLLAFVKWQSLAMAGALAAAGLLLVALRARYTKRTPPTD